MLLVKKIVSWIVICWLGKFGLQLQGLIVSRMVTICNLRGIFKRATQLKGLSLQWCHIPANVWLGSYDLTLFGCNKITTPSLCISRGCRKGRVPRHVPPSDISKGAGSRLQRGRCGDNAGQKGKKSFHPPSHADSQQASSQSYRSVWPCRRQTGGT